MRCLPFACIVLVACASAPPPRPTVTERAPVAWVPEARARLGHVKDDALADPAAELARLRAIAAFEIETEDPDHPGFMELVRLHHFDRVYGRWHEADAESRARLTESSELLIAALPVAGPVAFEAILELAPELLETHADAVLRFLQSSSPTVRARTNADYAIFGPYADALSLSFAHGIHEEGPLTPIFPRLSQEMRTWLRLRGHTVHGDVLTREEAQAMVAASYFPARAYLYYSLARGDAASAALLARAFLRGDVHDVLAKLVVELETELEIGRFPRDPRSIALLVDGVGPAELSHRVPDSNVAKLALLPILAFAGLREDYDTVRVALPSASTELLGPVLAMLDRAAHPSVIPGDDPAADAARATGSRALRAYAYSFDEQARLRTRALSTPPIVAPSEAVLALDPPAFMPWWLAPIDLAADLREQVLARITLPSIRARYARMLDCVAQGTSPYDACRNRPLRIASLAPEDFDRVTLEALERTPYFEGPELIAALDRMEGTAVSARAGYVWLRLRALVLSGDAEEAERRLATDGRVLSRAERLYIAAALLDMQAGDPPEPRMEDIPTPLALIDRAFSRGCPVVAYDAESVEPTSRHVWRAVALALSGERFGRGLDTARLEALLPRFTGHARQAISLYIAIGALAHRDRALFDRAFAESEAGAQTLIGSALALLSQSAFSADAPRDVEEGFVPRSLSYTFTARELDARGLDAGPAEAPAPDPRALPEPAATAYLRMREAPDTSRTSAFLRVRPSDENTRRLQCGVAVASFLELGPSPAFFGVPRTRPIQAALDLLTKKCVLDAPDGENDLAAIRVLALYADTLPDRARNVARQIEGIHELHEDVVALRIGEALRTSTPDFISLRLLGMHRVLSLALEDRIADARRALTENPRAEIVLDWMLDDIAEGRLSKSAAMIVLTWIFLEFDLTRRAYQGPIVLAGLVEQYPRSKLLVWASSRSTGTGMVGHVAIERHAEQLLRAAWDDAPLLRYLVVGLQMGNSPYADRARARAVALDPNVFGHQPAEDCEPPARSPD